MGVSMTEWYSVRVLQSGDGGVMVAEERKVMSISTPPQSARKTHYGPLLPFEIREVLDIHFMFSNSLEIQMNTIAMW